TIAH
ncbi:type III secretion system regulator LcrR, partial [Vibrio parahaemolyticus VP-48]